MINGFVQLADGLYGYLESRTTECSAVYLLVGTAHAILFDAGTGLDDVHGMVLAITELPVTVVLSHWHHDHVGLAHAFSDVMAWQSIATKMLRSIGIATSTIGELSGHAYAERVGVVAPIPQLVLIDHEQVIDIGGMTVQILHTPGHTLDSLCLYVPEKQWLFTGDTAYDGPLYAGLADSSRAAYLKSLERLMTLSIKRVLPGHNGLSCDVSILNKAHQQLDEVK